MRQAVLITTLLLGGSLLLLALVLSLAQRSPTPPNIFMMTSQRDGLDRLYLIGADGQREIWRGIGPHYTDLQPLGRSPDGQWWYLREGWFQGAAGMPYAEVARVRLDGSDFERLPTLTVTNQVFWSADGRWLYYERQDVKTGTSDLIRSDGRQVENLTDQFDGYVFADFASPIIISPDQTWVAFVANGSNQNAYRVDIASGAVMPLAQTSRGVRLVGTVNNATGLWLIVKLWDGAYRVRPDGTMLTRLLPPDTLIGDYVSLWQDRPIIVILRDQARKTLYGLNPDDFSVQWSIPDAYLPIEQPATRDLVILAGDGWWYRLALDGHMTRLIQAPTTTINQMFSPDGAWLLYQNYEPSISGLAYEFVWHSIRLSDGQTRVLHRADNSMALLAWSPDGASVVLRASNGPMGGLWQVGLADGHAVHLLQNQFSDAFLGMAQFKRRPNGRLGWIGGGLMVVSLGLIWIPSSKVRRS